MVLPLFGVNAGAALVTNRTINTMAPHPGAAVVTNATINPFFHPVSVTP
jgi:hypothetical protein